MKVSRAHDIYLVTFLDSRPLLHRIFLGYQAPHQCHTIRRQSTNGNARLDNSYKQEFHVCI